MCQPNHRLTQNKGIEQACYPVMQDHSEQYCAWTLMETLYRENVQPVISGNLNREPWIPILYIALSTEIRSSLNSDYIEQSLGLRYNLRHTTFILQSSFYAPFAVYCRR